PTPETKALLLIGALSDETGVSIETIRYYERIGLLASPPRSAGRRRQFGSEHLQTLKFIRRGREMGFSLEDIRTLLKLDRESNVVCAEARQITLRHLAQVREKVARLQKLERALTTISAGCRPGTQRSCPIIGALSYA